MNTNPDATVVLCYGDSNTYGQKADSKGRWPADVRWTGGLQDTLGTNFYIIEEGLSSRTTNLEYRKPGRNGRTHLVPCLHSHNPIDVLVLMLGTNDLKIEYERAVPEVAAGLAELISDVRQFAANKNGQPPQIVLVSPIHIDSTAPYFAGPQPHYEKTSEDKSKQLAAAIKSLAKEQGCIFVDAALVATPGEDGIHFSKESHAAFAHQLAEVIQNI